MCVILVFVVHLMTVIQDLDEPGKQVAELTLVYYQRIVPGLYFG